MRALTFASGQYVDCGSGASLDDLAATGGALTAWAWVYRTADGDNQSVITKDNAYPSGWGIVITNGSGGEGSIQGFVGWDGGQTVSAISDSSNVVALNTWTFIAMVYDNAASPKCTVYRGTMGLLVAEVTGYYQNPAPTGSVVSDASANLYVGNLQRSTLYPLLGRIGPCGVFNRALTVGELQQIQFSKRMNRAGGVLVGRAGENGTSTQPDWSGNGNTGTVTSATASDGPPSRHP